MPNITNGTAAEAVGGVVGMTPDWSVPLLQQKWRCSKQHIYSLITSGELRAFHVGRRIVVPAGEVERFERENVIAPQIDSEAVRA